MTEAPPTPESAADELDRRRWRALHEWAAAKTADRDDWDETALKGVMYGCKNAGVTYDEIEPVVWRIATTADDHRDFAELRDLARKRRPSVPAGSPPEVVMEVIRSGRYEALKAAYGTTSAVPTPRMAPEDNDSNDNQQEGNE